jgi:hypothetical protein
MQVVNEPTEKAALGEHRSERPTWPDGEWRKLGSASATAAPPAGTVTWHVDSGHMGFDHQRLRRWVALRRWRWMIVRMFATRIG